MKKIKILTILLISAFVLTACTHETLFPKSTSSEDTGIEIGDENGIMEGDVENLEEGVMEAIAEVIVTNDGFEPASVTVKKGESVTWINESDSDVWVASAFHPTHTVYPEFDQKEGMPSGENYTFVFEKVGTWKYHDHLNPTRFGEVIVTE